jgi:hypothetical protein
LIGKETFHRISRITNEIKERFAIARLLLFEAYDSPYQAKFYDEITSYIDLLDHSIYGVRSAKLKLTFEAAYNVLDKIASFINEYLNLGINEKSVGFISPLWKKQHNDTSLRQEIIKCDNIHLYALYDIARDLTRDSYLLPLKEIRDVSTHHYLVTHVFSEGDWHVESDGPQYHIGYRELLYRGISLLQVVRAAVIYLIAFIKEEEWKRTQSNDKKVVELPSWTHKPESLSPEDSWA